MQLHRTERQEKRMRAGWSTGTLHMNLASWLSQLALLRVGRCLPGWGWEGEWMLWCFVWC